jgi:hypothetical protein
MPKVEIDEAEYNRLAALQGIASKIVANPAARKRLEEAHKMVDPNATTPALDQERQQAEPLQAMEKKFADELAAIKKERDDERNEARISRIAGEQERGFRRLRTEYRYTDEGVEAIRKLMETKGLVDVDDAVAIFERSNPPPTLASPSGMTGSAWGFADVNADSDKSVQELIATKGAVDSVTDRMAMTALNEFRQAAGGRR